MIKKITSDNGFVFLFLDIPHKQRNNLGIASGESVMLSIYENDSYYFSSDINLIQYNSIAKYEEPTKLELKFFEHLREEKVVKYKRSLVDEFEIGQYVHYLPKVKYTQTNLDDHILIRGEITYTDNIYDREVPTILLKDEVIPLIDETYFEHLITKDTAEVKIDFKLDLPKQTITRSYKLKK